MYSSTITMDATSPHRLILIDGSGYVFRAFYSLPPMTRHDGTPVNAVYGFITILIRLLEEIPADYIAVVFDAARRTFRNDIYPAYKAHRAPIPDSLIPQFRLIREGIRAFNIVSVEQKGFEADDLIATYARQAVAQGTDVIICSIDKDLMQLVGQGIILWDPLKRQTIGRDQVRDKFGVYPEQVADVQALTGDTVDNIPGVPGIGIKTAADLITHFGNLENLLTHTSEITQPKRRQALIDHTETARLSLILARLKDDVPIITPLAALKIQPPDLRTVSAFLEAQAFYSLLASFRDSQRQRLVTVLSTAPNKVELSPALAKTACTYRLIQSLSDLNLWLSNARSAGIVAVSTLSVSQDNLTTCLVGISIAATAGETCYIPLSHQHLTIQGPLASSNIDGKVGNFILLPIAEVLKLLQQEILENRGVLKVGHNIKSDMHVFHTAGLQVLGRPITLAPIDDTMILSYVLNGSSTDNSIGELAWRYLGLSMATYMPTNNVSKTKIAFDNVTIEKIAHASEVVSVIWRLHSLLRKRLLAEHMVTVYETLDRPLISVLASIEQVGILVEESKLKELLVDFALNMTALEADIHRLAGKRFNIDSVEQTSEITSEYVNLPNGKNDIRSVTSKSDREVLEYLAAEGYKLPTLILNWRQLAKFKNTYIKALLAYRDRKTGRIYASLSQTATITGQLSSSDPNLQNILADAKDCQSIRRTFIAPPGYVLMSADYSQIELRLLAHMANVGSFKKAFLDGADIHTIIASQVFNIPTIAVNTNLVLRHRAKTINFGIIYGVSSFLLATKLGISRSETRAFIKAYLICYPEINDYIEQTKAYARRRNFVRTLLGRKCQVFGVNDNNANTYGARHVAINTSIKGSASDIVRLAMIRIPEALSKAGFNARLLLQVHGELIFEVPVAEIAPTIALIRSVMETVVIISVPLVANIVIGPNLVDSFIAKSEQNTTTTLW